MSLYQLERDGDVDSLLDHLALSDTPTVRKRAAELLGDLVEDEPQAVDGLIRAARTDDDEAVRRAAIDALDAVGPGAIERLVVELAGVDADGSDRARTEAFVETLSADRPELRMAATNALRRLGDPAALPGLVAVLDDPHPGVRARAARACGAIGDERAAPAVAARLDDSAERVRREAAEALAAIGTDRALSPLRGAASDDDEGVRYAAVAALGGYGRPTALDPLIAALDDDADVVRRAAAFSVIELLASAPSETSHRLREAVVDRLGTVDRSVIDPIVELVAASDQPRERRNAVWLVGRIAGDADRGHAADALVGALATDDETTARFAATSLVELGGEAVEEPLVEMLESSALSTAARAKAAFVLGRVGGERARDGLERVIDHSDDEALRKRASAALSKLGGRR